MKIFLLGFMGSGKSYWGRQLATALALPLVDLDEKIEKDTGLTISEIFAREGEAHFRTLERNSLKEALKKDWYVLSCGGGLPCFFDNMELMNRHGLTIWLDTPIEVMVERLERNKTKRPLLTGMDHAQLIGYVEKKLTERTIFYEQAKWVVQTTTQTPQSLAEKIKSCINHI